MFCIRRLTDDEGSRHLLDSRNARILRFAQNDTIGDFFSNLLGHIANSLAEKVEELRVGKSCLADDAFHDVFGQIEALMKGDRNPPWSLRVFEMNMGVGGFADIEPGLLQGANHFPLTT